MKRISRIIFGVYVLILLLFLIGNFTLLPVILLLFCISIFLIIVTIINLIKSVRKKGKMKSNVISLTILTIPLLVIFLIRIQEQSKEIILSAYSDGVINSSEIIFYSNNKMKYCSTSLFGEKYYYGKYELIDDTFYIKYINEIPKLKYTKIAQINNKLKFIDEEDNIKYEFLLDDKYNTK